jgi:hypothetical protein
MAFGVVFALPVYSAGVEFSHHPVLGWSKGATMEYVHSEAAQSADKGEPPRPSDPSD